MSLSKRTLLAIGAATALSVAAGAATLAIAQFSPWQDSPLMRGNSNDWTSSNNDVLGQLGANEGIYVDMKGFKSKMTEPEIWNVVNFLRSLQAK